MENVPDILNFGGHNIPQEMCEALEEMGYTCRYTLLNAAYYGVPEMRERLFLIAIDASLGIEPRFPDPTHWITLPRGYKGTRAVALKYVAQATSGKQYFVPSPLPTQELPPAITAREAIADLPVITAHLEGKMPRGTRRFDTIVPYPTDKPLSSYGRLIRCWPGFENYTGVADHVTRSLPRDYDIFSRMMPGDQYPQAHQHALNLFAERLAAAVAQEQNLELGSPEYDQLFRNTVPPYNPDKFPNRWRKMEADSPARTLTAHLSKDSYSHIHYDSAQARTISVREAARLQSFPDGFHFEGTMNPAFRQIGNAVPPLLANAIAHALLETLGILTQKPPLVRRLLDSGQADSGCQRHAKSED